MTKSTALFTASRKIAGRTVIVAGRGNQTLISLVPALCGHELPTLREVGEILRGYGVGPAVPLFAVAFEKTGNTPELCEVDGGVCFEAHETMEAATARAALFNAETPVGMYDGRYVVVPVPVGMLCGLTDEKSIVRAAAHPVATPAPAVRYFKFHDAGLSTDGKVCRVISVENNLMGFKGFDTFVNVEIPDHFGAGNSYITWAAMCRGEFVSAPEPVVTLASLQAQADGVVPFMHADDAAAQPSSGTPVDIRLRILIERAIVRRAVIDILASDPTYAISVFDGETYPLKRSRDVLAIMQNIGATDEDFLIVRKPHMLDLSACVIGEVRLVYGNDGYDVIADNDAALEPLLAGATALADEIEEALQADSEAKFAAAYPSVSPSL